MDVKDIMAKLKELIGEGNIDKAQAFMDEHKDDLGVYYEKAKMMLEDHKDDADGFIDKIKDFFHVKS